MDPLWYKDAVIYQLHVRSFCDGNNDGYGDFLGLRQKLPYLASLGVNTLWLLPFFESPLKDDGYDVSDYYKILPVHGTLEDFKAFLDEAHASGIRVMTEMVLNHTSSQHPWFQEARQPGSQKRDWYVWSETAERYKGVRIIFKDFEHSNWTWDPVAKAYYWHRFYSHQPDLNWANPEVEKALHEIMFYWLDMGVDGVRLDAIPYLYEREGTSCENLPETLDAIKRLRAAIDARYEGSKVLLAEANMWPEDTIPYFGQGDGVQMAFNFPIMPRLYMALRREESRPIAEMLQLTAGIPESAQWVVFLRNHDELTLEMVTDEERDYMYSSYAADLQYRINLGIRRRLSPLLEGDRRSIELLHAIVLSLKGSPVIYYGDEIGMGDNPFLGDRNGVRTPMQWSADKNAGFSRAAFQRLFLPPISEGPYSYQFVNVEAQQDNPFSLLNFTRGLLGVRARHGQIFGRGEMEILTLSNPKVLAFLRRHQGRTLLIVANLSRFAQPAMLPLSGFAGQVPIELFSHETFPMIGQEPYQLALGPHGFYWFEICSKMEQRLSIEPPPESIRPTTRHLPSIRLLGGLETMLIDTLVQGAARDQFDALLPSYLASQRWFSSAGSEPYRASLIDAVRLTAGPPPIYLTVIQVERGTSRQQYLLPLSVAQSPLSETLLQERPKAAIAWLRGNQTQGLLYDATASQVFWQVFFEKLMLGWKGRSLKGLYQASLMPGTATALPLKVDLEQVSPMTAEQTNSAAIVGNTFFKLYRRLTHGPNPEVEIFSHLSQVGFGAVPKLYGTVTLQMGRAVQSLGLLQEALQVQGDAWEYVLKEFDLYLKRVADMTPPTESGSTARFQPGWLENVGKEILDFARRVGVRLGEFHLAMTRTSDPALASVPTTGQDLHDLRLKVQKEMDITRGLLAAKGQDLPEELWEQGGQLLGLLEKADGGWQRIRIHGDLHLGQVLRTEQGLNLVDFEGEPDRPLEERRQKDQALRDVAGMLRSFEYAGLVALTKHAAEREKSPEDWAWVLIEWSQRVLLETYYMTAADAPFLPPESARGAVLGAYVLQKVLYEVRYELGHRPDWAWMPRKGLERLLKKVAEASAQGTPPAQ